MSMQERQRDTTPARQERSDFLDALKKGLLVGVALLVIIVPPLRMAKNRAAHPPAQVATAPADTQQPPATGAQPPVQTSPREPARGQGSAAAPQVRLADFRGEEPSPPARLVANWVSATQDNQRHAFVVVDKKDARVYVFNPNGTLRDSAPALLGAAHGDDSAPGIGDKPLSAVRPDEKTTPAGRFLAEPGRNTKNEDIVWVDYDAAVSMHRVRPLVAAERRLERLATLTTDDNRISFGCINLPVTFYENVLSPAVQKYGAVIYVLPEMKSVQQVFGAFDVTDPAQVAAAQKARAQKAAMNERSPVQQVALQPAR
jgi:hypothetical protein